MPPHAPPTRVAVIVPAHDEEAVIARGLAALLRAPLPGLRVHVVANGCTDRTVERARAVGDARVEVHDLPEPGKARAIRTGLALVGDADVVAVVDADVELDEAALPGLVDALAAPEPRIAAPSLRLVTDECSPLVRRYFTVWADEPYTRAADVAGRGVYAVNAAGLERLVRMPDVLADDGWARAVFVPDERVVAPGVSVVRPARTARALIRRRARVLAGNRELGEVLPVAARPGHVAVVPRGARARLAAHGAVATAAWYAVELPARAIDAWRRRRGVAVVWGADATTRR